ncbi:hypothetical protein [Microvirga pudoricolor]|uniref:hypothetical protein n=1 Tax=Microvirga pudoricolor TaxID=2778729 RepID=UPI0019523E29|nr:hypothetical protein [Microvirga pudoricolor]MBM6592916.1 hypothetical protein [Microvirga pudoricolor]
MDIVLHIGTEKTGTTTIQELLHKNRDALIRNGYYFLSSPGIHNNRDLAAYCLRQDRFDDHFRAQLIDTPEKREVFQRDFLRRFDDELAAIPPHVHTVLATSEHFHSRVIHDDEIETLKRLLAERFERVRVLTYLRKQIDAALSAYTTFLISGGHGTLHDFVSDMCRPDNPYFDYLAYLARWEKAFGRENLTVRIFEPGEFLNGDLVDDFFDQVDPELGRKIDRRIESKNESVNQFGQTLLNIINRYVPRLVPGIGLNRRNIDLSDIVLDGTKGRSVGLDEVTYDGIQSRFEAVNEAVRRGYFPHRSSLFSPGQGKAGPVLISPDNALILDRLVERLTRESRDSAGASPVPPVYADQIASLTQLLSETEANRGLVHSQLVAMTNECIAVTANRDTVYEQLVAANDRLARQDADLRLLRRNPMNRIMLKLRDAFRKSAKTQA